MDQISETDAIDMNGYLHDAMNLLLAASDEIDDDNKEEVFSYVRAVSALSMAYDLAIIRKNTLYISESLGILAS
jgi:hypothetical protein